MEDYALALLENLRNHHRETGETIMLVDFDFDGFFPELTGDLKQAVTNLEENGHIKIIMSDDKQATVELQILPN